MTRAAILASLTVVLALVLGIGLAARAWLAPVDAEMKFDSKAWIRAGKGGEIRKIRASMLPDLLDNHLPHAGTAYEVMLILGEPDWRTEEGHAGWHYLTTEPYPINEEPDSVELEFAGDGRFLNVIVHGHE
jgi:hypothetical protein